MNRLSAAALSIVLVAASAATTTAVILWPRGADAQPVNARLAMAAPLAGVARL